MRAADLDAVFGALADPTRRAILAALERDDATVSALARPFPISLNAVSKHLTALERAGLLSRTVRGREHWCHLEAAPLVEAANWVDRYRAFWEERLDALERHLGDRRTSRARRRRSRRHA